MKRFLSLCLALVMLLALVACGGDKPATPGTPSSPGSSAAPSRTKLVYPLTGIGDSMDPHAATMSVDMMVTEQVYEGMHHIKEDGTLEPCLATSYEISADGLTYTYKLRQGVKFHNGDPVTVEDVVYSFQRCIDNKFRGSWLPNLAAVEAVGTDAVKFTLSAPNAVFETSMNMVPVVCKKVVEEMGDNFKLQVSEAGSGPYRFVSYDPNNKIVLESNPDYWRGEAAIKTIEYVIITDAAARLMALESGDIDFAAVSANDLAIVQANKNLVMEPIAARATYFIALNTGNDKSPLYDKRVRQAIAYCVNKEDIIEIAVSGQGMIADTFVSPSIPDAPKNEEMPLRYTRNIEKAKALLKEAGYPNGFEMTISCGGGTYVPISEVFQENLAEIGIKATIQNGEKASISSDAKSNPDTVYDAFPYGWSWGVSYNEYLSWYTPGAEHYPHAYKNKEFDQAKVESMKADALAAKSLEERKAGWAKIDEYLTDYCAIIPLYNTVNNQAWNKDLNAVTYSLRPYFYDWSWK